jgi:type I restriction enzyme S subunit
MIDVSPTQLQTIQAILKRIAPTCEARVFGSRYQWTAKDYSDLDLAMVGDGKLPFKKLSALRTAFEESDLPYRVDVLDWHAISPEFQKVIERGYEVIQMRRLVANSNEWIETTIGEFCPFEYGKSLKETDRQTGNVPVFGSNGRVGYHNQAIVESKGVIIGRKGTAGAVHYSDEPFCPIDTTFYVAESPDKDIRYIYFLLKSVGLEHMNSDSAVPGLNRTAAHSRIIEVPKSLEEQRAIAGVLGALDDKIELNRRMNRTLESMARGVFAEMMKDELGRM